jgi:transposase
MHFTREFEAFALVLMREMPMKKAAEILQETDTRLWRLLFAHVETGYGQADFSQVCCLGVDEMSVHKGHQFITIFADLIAKRVLFATEGRDTATWTAFVEALEKHNGHPHAITQVSMDMWRPYQRGVADHCRNAEIVFDKFHVIQNVNEAIDKVRGAEVRLGYREVREALRETVWIWRKNPENLTEREQQRLAKIQDKNLCTAKAYQMRLVLQGIYRSENKTTAKHRFKVWCRWVRWVARFYQHSIFAPMLKAAQMIENHLSGILAHWKWGVTNAFMEGLNSVFSATKRRARGFRSTTHLITMLYFVAGKLRLPAF